MLMSKSKMQIIVGLTQSFNFSNLIVTELEKLGFEVINIAYPDHSFHYKNHLQRIQNFLMKTFLIDKHFKDKLKFKPFEKEIVRKLNNVFLADFALIIRPDIYPKKILQLVKTKSKKMIGYQWDGLDRYKSVGDLIDLFDRFFGFDINSEKNGKKILPLTNFYFENPELIGAAKENTAFFFGSYFPARMLIIEACAAHLIEYGVTPNFAIFTERDSRTQLHDFPHVRFVSASITYHEYLNHIKNASILADFLNPVHKGLSFRVFESIGYHKKLITTNESVRQHEFYNPNNIFILKDNNFHELLAFLNTRYEPIPEVIREKYSFKHWINYVLDLH